MSSLKALHIELIEHIVTFLELRDIASLRLTCRAIKSKASQGCFATFFKQDRPADDGCTTKICGRHSFVALNLQPAVASTSKRRCRNTTVHTMSFS